MLTEDEAAFVAFVLAVGDRALDREPFGFMIEEGAPADAFADPLGDAGDYDVNYPTLLPRCIRASVVEGEALMWTLGNQSPTIGR